MYVGVVFLYNFVVNSTLLVIGQVLSLIDFYRESSSKTVYFVCKIIYNLKVYLFCRYNLVMCDGQ